MIINWRYWNLEENSFSKLYFQTSTILLIMSITTYYNKNFINNKNISRHYNIDKTIKSQKKTIPGN